VGSEGERRKGEGKLGGGEVCSMALRGDRRPWSFGYQSVPGTISIKSVFWLLGN
jgi:hypothetical protein